MNAIKLFFQGMAFVLVISMWCVLAVYIADPSIDVERVFRGGIATAMIGGPFLGGWFIFADKERW